MFGCLSSQRRVPNRLPDKDTVGLVSLEAAFHWERLLHGSLVARRWLQWVVVSAFSGHFHRDPSPHGFWVESWENDPLRISE